MDDDVQVELTYLDHDDTRPLGAYHLRFRGAAWERAKSTIKARGGKWDAAHWNGRGAWRVSAQFLVEHWNWFFFENERAQQAYIAVILDIVRARAAHERKRAEQRARRARREQRQTPPPVAPLAAAYSALGLSPDADRAAVQQAYRQLAKTHHPDHGGSHEQMIALTFAYETLLRHLKERMA